MIGVLGNGAGNLEEGSAQMGRTAPGDSSRFGVERAGLERRRVYVSESHQSALMGKAAHIANLRHALRAGDLSRAVHLHDHIEFR